ncbi:MAG TPA: universal stress protein [Parafilimonas sp.]|nr:universal stress protein [Parafilimonas sp.]
MRTIIAPTDFSNVSNNAAHYAAKMAEDVNAQLILLHVMELPITVSEFPVTEAVFDEISMEDELKKLKSDLLKTTKGKIKIHVTNILGSVENELKEICNIEKPFAVVMGTHTHGTLQRFLLGSTALYSTRHLEWPVLIVPEDDTYKPIRKIGLASDMKYIYSVPLNQIASILDAFGASLDVFHVNRRARNIEKDSVESILLKQRLLALNPRFSTINDEDVEHGVEALAKKNDTDLIVVIPRSHGLFHKAQSAEFVFRSSLPVMAIHESKFVEEEIDA